MIVDYSKWPVREFERGFYKQVEVGTHSFLVPSGKLGDKQIRTARIAQREAAKKIITPEILATLREERKAAIERALVSAKKLLEEAKAEDKAGISELVIGLESRETPTGNITDDDADYYVSNHRADDEIFLPWIESLYKPLAGNPSIRDLYEYIPSYIFSETIDFFAGSDSAPEEKSNGTAGSSLNANG